MQKFKEQDRVIFRESQTGEPEHGMVEEVIPADDQFPMGGLYIVRLDADLSCVEAFWVELTPEQNSDSV